MATIPEAIRIAYGHQQAGRLHEAEKIYRQVLEHEPHQPDALHLLGLIALQVRQYPAAADCIRRAIAAAPQAAHFHNSLGLALRGAGDSERAGGAFRQALQLQPDYAEAHFNLATELLAQGSPDAAAVEFRHAIRLKPDDAEAQVHLAAILDGQGQFGAAEEAYCAALRSAPGFAHAFFGLGTLLGRQGRLADAARCLQQAVQLRPEHAESHLNLGRALLDLGRLDEAIAACRNGLALLPDSAEAHTNLANALRERGLFDEAHASCRRALELKPGLVEAQISLGNLYQDQGRMDEALDCFRAALNIRPDAAAAHLGLGNLWYAQGRLDEAAAGYEQALALRPAYAEACNNLGIVRRDQGRLDEAVALYRQAVELRPNYGAARNNLGIGLQSLGDLDGAVACFRQAIELQPRLAEAHKNLGQVLNAQGDREQALDSLRRALELKPDFADAHLETGNVLKDQGALTDAVESYHRALALHPENADTLLNLGNALKDQGRIDEALTWYRRAVDAAPARAEVLCNLLHAAQYRADASLALLAEVHTEYEQRFARPLRSTWQPHLQSREPGRRLRLGFVSPDFSRHPVGFFLIRVLEHLDRRQCEVVCYSNRSKADEMTHRFQAAAELWRDVAGLSDGDLADRIRSDQIDMLFDLSGHTAHNRLLVFARKPAPIQISWLGYEGTTGLSAMDYVLADRFEIPVDAEPFYVERVLRMPHGFACYDPPADAPPVGPLPALTQGSVTFGSFNNLAKLTPAVVQLWAKLLQRLPDSRLLLKFHGLDDGQVRQQVCDRFAACGVSPQRLELQGPSPHPAYLAEYNRVDLALDPFPFNGGVTTCAALWMGVPVITCPGETFASRHSLSHLTNAGLTGTIARNHDESIELAVGLARDLPRLAAMRSGLRAQVAASPLCNGQQFASDLLSLLRGVWQQWCQTVAEDQPPNARGAALSGQSPD